MFLSAAAGPTNPHTRFVTGGSVFRAKLPAIREAPISVGVSFLWFWPLSIPLAAFEFCSGFGD
jgi:hypothetical protein